MSLGSLGAEAILVCDSFFDIKMGEAEAYSVRFSRRELAAHMRQSGLPPGERVEDLPSRILSRGRCVDVRGGNAKPCRDRARPCEATAAVACQCQRNQSRQTGSRRRREELATVLNFFRDRALLRSANGPPGGPDGIASHSIPAVFAWISATPRSSRCLFTSSSS